MVDTKSNDEYVARSPRVSRLLKGMSWVWVILALGAYLRQFSDEAVAVVELLGLGGR